MALSLGIIFGPRGTRVSITSSPANTQMESATLLTLQVPMGLGHLISRHLHRRVHPLCGRLPTQRTGHQAGPTIQQC